jgi:hypothetical protein
MKLAARDRAQLAITAYEARAQNGQLSLVGSTMLFTQVIMSRTQLALRCLPMLQCAMAARSSRVRMSRSTVSSLVLTEVHHLAKVRFGSLARPALIDFIVFQAWRGRFRVLAVTIELPETDLDLADGFSVSLAAEHRTCSV